MNLPLRSDEKRRMRETSDIALTDQEWDQVVKRLSIVAVILVRADTIRGLGIGPEDLVSETMRRLFDPSTGVKWRTDAGPPTVPKVSAFLGVVLRNYFLDCLRQGAHTHSVPNPVEPESEGEHPDGAPADLLPADRENVVASMFLKQLYSRTRALAEQKDDVDVVFYLDLQMREGGLKNAEAAASLGITAAEIVNIRKRLNLPNIQGQAGSRGGRRRP
jgi:DNA-directed RNA polymerase specialized sigma24 family protein